MVADDQTRSRAAGRSKEDQSRTCVCLPSFPCTLYFVKQVQCHGASTVSMLRVDLGEILAVILAAGVLPSVHVVCLC